MKLIFVIFQNGVEELEKIDVFLDSNRNSQFIQTVYTRCGFASMKVAKETDHIKQMWRDEKPNMYRKGLFHTLHTYNIMFPLEATIN